MLTICFFHQPVDVDTTKVYVFDLRNDIADGRTTVEDAVEFQMAVGAEDKAMLEKFRTYATPIDLQAEVHTPPDRNTVEMRRILADLVADHHVRRSATTSPAPEADRSTGEDHRHRPHRARLPQGRPADGA